jgi:hypothetical protein
MEYEHNMTYCSEQCAEACTFQEKFCGCTSPTSSQRTVTADLTHTNILHLNSEYQALEKIRGSKCHFVGLTDRLICKSIWKEHQRVLKMKNNNSKFIAVHFLLVTDMQKMAMLLIYVNVYLSLNAIVCPRKHRF